MKRRDGCSGRRICSRLRIRVCWGAFWSRCVRERDLIKKIPLVANAEGGSLEPLRSSDVLRAMYWLRQCGGLMELELDEQFLSNPSWTLKVKVVTSKTRTRFIQYEEVNRGDFLGSHYPPVYKILYSRQDSEDLLARRLAIRMARQRPLKNDAVRALYHRSKGDANVLHEDEKDL